MFDRNITIVWQESLKKNTIFDRTIIYGWANNVKFFYVTGLPDGSHDNIVL